MIECTYCKQKFHEIDDIQLCHSCYLFLYDTEVLGER